MNGLRFSIHVVHKSKPLSIKGVSQNSYVTAVWESRRWNSPPTRKDQLYILMTKLEMGSMVSQVHVAWSRFNYNIAPMYLIWSRHQEESDHSCLTLNSRWNLNMWIHPIERPLMAEFSLSLSSYWVLNMYGYPSESENI